MLPGGPASLHSSTPSFGRIQETLTHSREAQETNSNNPRQGLHRSLAGPSLEPCLQGPDEDSSHSQRLAAAGVGGCLCLLLGQPVPKSNSCSDSTHRHAGKGLHLQDLSGLSETVEQMGLSYYDLLRGHQLCSNGSRDIPEARPCKS